VLNTIRFFFQVMYALVAFELRCGIIERKYIRSGVGTWLVLEERSGVSVWVLGMYE
jgi:hypothetical protein